MVAGSAAPVCNSPTSPVADTTTWGVAGGLAASWPSASTTAASSCGLITPNRMSSKALSALYFAMSAGPRSVSVDSATKVAVEPAVVAAALVEPSCARQVGHQVAKNSTNTGVPVNSPRVKVLPSLSVTGSVCQSADGMPPVIAGAPVGAGNGSAETGDAARGFAHAPTVISSTAAARRKVAPRARLSTDV